MPRNSSGTYTLPESAFVSGTVIQSAPVNSDFNDIASALTLSLATTGVSTMTGPIKAASGTVTAPSYTFGSALGTGFYLSGTDAFSWTAGGVLAATFASTGIVTWVAGASFGGNISVTGTFAATGNGTIGGDLAVTGAGTFAGITSVHATTPSTFRNSTNSTAILTVHSYALGTGAGTTASFRMSGTGANDIDSGYWYIGTTPILSYGVSIIYARKNLAIDTSNIIVLATAGYADFTNIAAPIAPAASTIRAYAITLDGTTEWSYKDPSGREHPMAPIGSVIGTAYGENATFASSSTTIPLDDTIPQISEGDLICTATIILKYSTSRVRCSFQGFASLGAGATNVIVALFRGAGADAIQVGTFRGSANLAFEILLEAYDAPGASGSTAYTVRAGVNSAGAYSFNTQTVGTRLFGGAAKATLIVQEILQ